MTNIEINEEVKKSADKVEIKTKRAIYSFLMKDNKCLTNYSFYFLTCNNNITDHIK